MQYLTCPYAAACRIVLAQLTGSGRGGLGSYNSQQHTDLMAYLEEEALRDGDAWLKGLLKRNEMLGALQPNCVSQGWAQRHSAQSRLHMLGTKGRLAEPHPGVLTPLP